MTTRYIAIEHNSGFVWGHASTATPEAACAAIDHEADESRATATWERVPPIRDTDGGYHVYVAPQDFPNIDDGQDQSLIERVEAECQHIGDYRPRRDTET